MSKALKKKIAALIILEIISVLVLGVFLNKMQMNISANDQAVKLQQRITILKETIAEAKTEAEEHTTDYDAMYRSKVASLAYMIQEQVDSPEISDALMSQYKELLNITNAVILDRSGNVLAKAQESSADFAQSDFDELRTVFTTENTSEPFEVKKDDQSYRYYGAKIDENMMAVIEQDPAELTTLLEDTTSWKSMLSNITIGTSGYAFAISATDYTFTYHPDKKLIGTDSLDAGIEEKALADSDEEWMTINGEKYLCSVAKMDDCYIVCALPETEIQESCAVTVAVVLLVYFAIITLIVNYGIFIMKAQEKDGESASGGYKKIGGFYFNKKIATKLGAIVVAGLLCVFISSLYMQELFSVSSVSMSCNQNIESLQTTIKNYEKDIEKLKEQYNTRYLNKCRVVAHILDKKPEYRTREELSRLSQIMDVEFISFFDSTGTVTATSSYEIGFKLSQNKEDQSYEFNKLLAGGDYVVQEAKEDDSLGVYRQYVGVAIHDANGLTEGFAQICVNPSVLENATSKLQITSVLDGVQVGINGFAFALKKKNHIFAYYPQENYIGRDAMEYGIKKSQIHDGFSDYITIGTQKYYASCLETENYYVYSCVPDEEIASHKLPIALLSTGVSLVCLLIMSIVLCFHKIAPGQNLEGQEENNSGIIDVTMPGGTKKQSTDVSTRWSNVAVRWSEKSPEQKMASLGKGLLMVYSVIICIAYWLEKQFQTDSLFAYIIRGEWERGINIFAATGCIFIICIVVTLTTILHWVIHVLCTISSAKGETVFRLLGNFVKYASVIALLYYCFALFGVDTKALLASAGLLGLMISLGAQKLVQDILAGLFIIFEGEFRVGDIVTIGDWRGTVIEIGIRTTKIEEGGGNMKIINNSSISGVINMTRQYSYAGCDFGIEYGESLERVEYILKKELPKMKERIPTIKNGPFYKGVSELADSSVNIKIVAQCAEGDRIQLTRDLNREMKLIFDKYEINMPFPQVVLNQPAEFKKATEWEKKQAEKFAKEQKEISRDVEDEQL